MFSRIVKKLVVLFGACVLALVCAAPTVAKADTLTINVVGNVDTRKGYELLSLVNQARSSAGVGQLVWDADLAATAMQRAMETAVYSSHTRPNGSDCYSAFPSAWKGTGAENIAYGGYSDASSANDVWTKSSGHYKNMIGEKYKTFGAAVYEAPDGRYYWVECFSGNQCSNTTGNITSGVITRSVSINTGLVSLTMRISRSSSYSMYADMNEQLTPMINSAGLATSAVTWSSSDSSVVSVTSGGLFTSLYPGSATITGTLKSNSSYSASVSVYVNKISLLSNNVSLEYDSIVWSGEAVEPEVTVTVNGKTLMPGTDYTVTYSNNAKAGTATVRVAGEGKYGSSVSRTFKITAADISEASFFIVSQTYTGSALKPTMSVTFNGNYLTAGTDFTVVYSNNTNAGTGQATFTGKGNYTGTKTVYFTIYAASLGAAAVSVADQKYTGSALTPAPTVTLDGKTLVAGTDYTVSYSNNVNVGTATVSITGKGNYKDTITATFSIAPTHVGWYKDGSDWYYYETNGTKRTNNWASYNGVWYYFGADGKLVWNGWATYNGKYYYMGSNGQAIVNQWKQIGGTWYHFNKSGVCDQVWKG